MNLDDIKVGDVGNSPPYHVNSEEKVSSVIGVMKKRKEYVLPVRKGKETIGVITAESILYSNVPPTTAKAETLVSDSPFMQKGESLAVACEKMWKNELKSVPVGSKERLEGMLTFWDIADWCLKQGFFKKLKITEIGIRDLPVIKGKDNVDKAKAEMREEQISKLLVEDEKTSGLLGGRKLLETVSKTPKTSMTKGDRKGEKQKFMGMEAGGMAQRIRVRLNEDASIHDLFEKMKRHRSTYAFIVDHILTYKDILKYLSELKPEESPPERVRFVTKGKIEEDMLSSLKSEINSFLEIYDKKFGRNSVKDFRVTINQTREKGRRTFFEMSAKMLTDYGDFYAEKKGWNFPGMSKDMIEAIRRQVWP